MGPGHRLPSGHEVERTRTAVRDRFVSISHTLEHACPRLLCNR
jgi:hypothetical protein